MKAGLVWAAVVVVSAHAGSSAAQGGVECRPNPHLARAKDEYDRLEFDRAAKTLQRAIEHTRNCKWDLAEIYRLKAFVDAVHGERERCQRAFEILLALDADYASPEDLPPKIRDCFGAAERVPKVRRELRLMHSPPTEVPPNSPVAIGVQVVDPLRLADDVQVYFRRDGVKVYTLVSARADENVSVLIPGLAVPPDEQGYRMEYFVRAVDRWEGTLDELGSARDPLRFSVLRGPTTAGVLSKWWFWTALGAVVLGALAGAVYVGQAGSDAISLTIKDGGSRP